MQNKTLNYTASPPHLAPSLSPQPCDPVEVCEPGPEADERLPRGESMQWLLVTEGE